MATRTGKPGTVTSGDLAQAVDINALGGGLVAYATPITSNQSTITTVVDVTGATLTYTPNDSRILKVCFDLLVDMTTASTNDVFSITILQAGTQIKDVRMQFQAASQNVSMRGSVLVFNPASSSTVWKLQAQRAGGSTGTFQISGSATTPGEFWIEDMSPSF